MADASSTPSRGVAEPRARGIRKWLSLVAEVPYFAIVIIGIVGVSWTNMLGVSVATYWVTMTPIAALLCVCVGWAHVPRGRNRLEMAAIQFGQWAAVLVAMYLIHVSNADGLVTHDALGSILLTLLALGVFISGLDLRTWKLCVAGAFLALAVPFVAWVADAGLFIFLIGIVLIALGLLAWWGAHRLASARVSQVAAALALAAPVSGRRHLLKRRHVFVIASARDLRGEARWRLKNGRETGWAGQAGREGELRYRFVRSRLGPRHGGKNEDWRTPASRRFVRAPRVGEGASTRALKLLALARLAPLLASVACSGCAPVGPNFERPAAIVSPQFKEIKGWKIATPRANEPKGEWWSVFHDPELDQLMRVVAVSNQTIKADEANYRQALALINEARAGLFPTVNGTGSATRALPGGTNLTAEATGAWTLDVWGQVRREIEAQQAGAETNAAVLANALLAAQSALALAYVTLRQADSLEDLLARTIEDYKRSVTITQNQYNAGTAAKSDVITAQAQLLNAQAALIAAGVTRAQSEHAIAVLMGRPPAGLSIPHGSLATRVPPVPVGLPSSLLERRPDVAAAEETMRAANAQIGVAFAGYFPAVSLYGLIGYSGNPFATEFGASNPVWSFGASLAQPLFNGGLTTAQVEAARQTYQADVADLSPDGADGDPAGRGCALGDSHPVARGQSAGGGRAHLPAGDADHAQRIQGRNPGFHGRCHRGDATIERRRVAAVDPGPAPSRRGQPYRRARRRLEPIEAA